MKSRFLLIIVAFATIIMDSHLDAQTLYNGIGHIPTYYQETWNKAGLIRDMSSVEPKMVINVGALSGPTDSDRVELALTNARSHVLNTQGLAIIYFPTGTYYLSRTIKVTPNDSNIVFQGAGSDRTTLRFANMKDDHCFDIHGSSGNWVDLDENFNKGDSVFHTAASLNGIDSGDWIQLIKHKFDYETSSDLEAAIVGQITQLVDKGSDAGGEWGEIKDVANMNYIDSAVSDSSLKVREITPARNIGIEDLRIERYPSEQATDDDANQIYNINIANAVNCWVKGVESYKPSRYHLDIYQSAHIEVSGCYFHEAEHYGGGGWGYGVVTYGSATNNLIENNIFRKLRHAMTAAGGSNLNVWTFNYSREQHSTWNGIVYGDRDLDLHAKYPFGHLFEHNIIEEIAATDYHGLNGPYSAFVRNFVYDGNVNLDKITYWSSLGNIRNDNPINAPWHNFTDPPVFDVFGFFNNYANGYSHNTCWNYIGSPNAELYDVSYYYSQRPDFLPTNYT